MLEEDDLKTPELLNEEAAIAPLVDPIEPGVVRRSPFEEIRELFILRLGDLGPGEVVLSGVQGCRL